MKIIFPLYYPMEFVPTDTVAHSLDCARSTSDAILSTLQLVDAVS